MVLGYLKGETCNRDNCNGIIDEYETGEGCSCHINPPCSYCTTSRAYCQECDWDGRQEQLEAEQAPVYKSPLFKVRQFEDLDRSKIDFLSLAHTHFSMIKKGVFPKNTTRQEVERIVKGTFGGRFVRFDEIRCEFEYVSYTD